MFVSLAGTLLSLFHCTDGDGGVPYVARDSPQKGVCDATADGLLTLPVLLLAVGGMAALAVAAQRESY